MAMSRPGRVLFVALPELAPLSSRSRRRLATVVLCMLAALLVNVAHTGLGLGGERLDVPLNAWLQNVVLAGAFVLVAARAALPGPERAGWIALAAGIGCWSVGNLYGALTVGLDAQPGQTLLRDRLRDRHARELRAAAIEAAAHPAHHRDDLLASGQLAARAGRDDAGGLDPRHAQERDFGVGEAEPGLQLGAVQPEGLD